MSNIEWTQKTWNPIAGCSKVSPGCANCYAEVMAGRLAAMGQTKYQGLTVLQGKHARWTGKIAFDEDALLAPLRKKKPTTYFVNSMSDLFHEDVTDEQIDRVFAVMALSPQHTFQVLTKRPERMRRWFVEHYNVVSPGSREMVWSYLQHLPGYSGTDSKWISVGANAFDVWPLPNVWLGVSVENQNTADERIPLLLETPAAVRFISAEPLLGSVDLTVLRRPPSDLDRSLGGFERFIAFYRNSLEGFNGAMRMDGKCFEEPIGAQPKLDWVIVGGESGSGARPCRVEWMRSLVEQCVEAGVSVFVKQVGRRPAYDKQRPESGLYGFDNVALEHDSRWPDSFIHQLKDRKGGDMSEWPEDLRVRQMPEVRR